ncbi:hypothetical protein [Amycolatopsis sp. FDAARGOS 1241]|uniref:hypothetical protein n=1 Tax=Amycolatopsis sp. FDAARGOS 1241 TaxID=2778070 RepID=UPI00194E2F2D|nr:hypothetical protein [Amycolatopsis sp. FDAARGOS 1241]QRP42972.1 hypothetical protein I6J71_26365 [Amycolatopsis sp. FDAARGOS 1241]
MAGHREQGRKATELALEHLAAHRGRIDRDLLAHVSPALMEHVNPYGTCEFSVQAEYAHTGFRPLQRPRRHTVTRARVLP